MLLMMGVMGLLWMSDLALFVSDVPEQLQRSPNSHHRDTKHTGSRSNRSTCSRPVYTT